MSRTRSILLLAALALTVSACSASFSIGGIDAEEVQSTIVDILEEDAQGLGTAEFAPWTADCPDVPSTLDEGDTFACTATDVDGDSLNVTVTADDDEGNVTITY